jgi:iron complex outermembrane receptor protein
VKKISWQGNFALSQNKIKNFSEYISIDDSAEQQINNYSNTDISFSPNSVASSTLTLEPFKQLRFSIISKYVGKQYLDNTQSDIRKLDAFIKINFQTIEKQLCKTIIQFLDVFVKFFLL